MWLAATIRALQFMSLLLVFLGLTTTAVVRAQTGATAPVSQPASDLDASVQAASNSGQPTVTAIKIGAGDLLKISVLGAPESEQEVRVAEDGTVPMNFLGSVHVAGLSSREAQDVIAKMLAAGGFFTQPQVSVFIKEYATQGVSVLGEVSKPGVYPILGSRRLFDVLSMAGGTTQKAGKIVSITHRDQPDAPRSVPLSNEPDLSAKSNVEIYAGDTILVSRAGVVYVVGDVKKPSGVIMDNGSEMTVLQAIAMAEGTNPTAALNKAKLIRRTPDGPKEMPLALKDMLTSKAPDLRLQAEDIIFVPGSAAKSATKRSMEMILQTVSGLAIYGLR